MSREAVVKVGVGEEEEVLEDWAPTSVWVDCKRQEDNVCT